MKTLSNEQIIYLLEHCNNDEAGNEECEGKCPLFNECLHYWTGEECQSALESEDKMTRSVVTCPHCGSKSIDIDDCYDWTSSETQVKEYYCGHCNDCKTNLQWTKVFNFIGYENIEED